MIAIYSDSEIIDKEWIWRLNFPDVIQIYHSFDEYSKSPCNIKIAFTADQCNRMEFTKDEIDFHYDQDCRDWGGENTAQDKIIKLSETSDLVFFMSSELHIHYIKLWWVKCHRPNVYWIYPGSVDFRLINENVITWPYYFKKLSAVYKKIPSKLAELNPYQEKPVCFDALLGKLKPHRSFVYESFRQHNLESYMTYQGVCKNDEFFNNPGKDHFAWEPGCVPLSTVNDCDVLVDYLGCPVSLNFVIPIDVYNNTAYSILTETNWEKVHFLTEKTSKCLIARRLFVAFAGPGFLKALKQLGFQTFDSVIDESYDLIFDNTLRWQAAFEQVKLLHKLPQADVLGKIRPILEHNHDLIMRTDWTQFSVPKVQTVIDQIQL